MILTLTRRFDITATHLWLRNQVWIYRHISRPLYRWRWWLVAYAVTFSVLDLLLTQHILTMVEGRTGVQPGEGNALMAPIVMTWWAWPIRVGLPLLFLLHDVRPKKVTTNVAKAAFAAVIYGAVVAWNTHMLMIVRAG